MPKAALKTGWPHVAFGDVVRLSKERSRDPEEDGFERYVGLEHLDPGDLKIRRWGNVADGTTFTNVFRPGQVLFGKRRAYQRKVAVSDFSGVCSGDIYVLEPKNEHLLPELLPFICQTEAFFEHAIGTSAGSLSPRTNWKSLATYEFALPLLEEQRRIADLLQHLNESFQRTQQLALASATVESSIVRSQIPPIVRESGNVALPVEFADCGWSVHPVESLGTVLRGSSPRPKSDPRYYGGPVPRLTVEDINRDGMYVTPKVDSLTEEGAKLSRPVPKGTLVMVCSGNIGEPSILAIDACIHDGILAVTELDDSVSAEYLYYAFRRAKREFLRLTTNGGIWSNLTTDVLKSIQIPVPPAGALARFVKFLARFSSTASEANGRVESHRRFMQQVLNSICGAKSQAK